MEALVVTLPLLLFALLLFLYYRRGGKNAKTLLEATNKSTESSDRLTEAVNRLADVIAKK
ncbi:hypothetical protein ACFLTP_03125 [Chloroflexota bacterium]